ncbi:MAG: hypothetical protein ABIP97_10790 [Chthoniobacterales bacterium]
MPFLHWMKKALQGDAEVLADGVRELTWYSVLRLLIVIVLGSALYGATVGMWRSPLQGVYSAIKIPLLLLLTCAGNGMLNALFASVLGANLTFRQTLAAIGISFSIAAVILASLSPLSLFLMLNVPPIANGSAVVSHSVVLLFHVGVIAFAGVLANVRLQVLLQQFCPDRRTGLRVLLAWLAGNLLLGSQLAWVLRPFIGSPRLRVEFLRPDAFHGSFFEEIFKALMHVFHQH